MKTALAVIPTLTLLSVSLPSSLTAQAKRPLVEIGAGTLAPHDPFSVTLAFRAGAGWAFGAQDAITLEYTRQSANRSEGSDLGKFARHLIGFGWQHAFVDAFDDPEPLKLQYLTRLGGGIMIRGAFPSAVEGEELGNVPFVDFGLVIRYPMSTRVRTIVTVEDAPTFLPQESVRSYCTRQGELVLCYPVGGNQYYTLEFPARTQHNFGVLLTVQLRL